MHNTAFWMNHFNAEETWAGFPQQPYAPANGIGFHLAAVKIQKAHEQHAGGIFHLAHQLAPRAIHDFTSDYYALDLYCLVCRHITDRIEMSFVFIAQRQMQHQIEFIGDTQPGEFFLNCSADRTDDGERWHQAEKAILTLYPVIQAPHPPPLAPHVAM